LVCALPAQAQSYERYTPPELLPARTRALAHVVRAFGHRHQQALHYDWRLMHAAERQLAELLQHPEAKLDIEALRAWAQKLGWTDGELSALSVTTRDHALAQTLQLQLEQALGDHEATVMGLAVSPPVQRPDGWPDQATVVVALSRRLLRLAPVPQARPVGGTLQLTGTAPKRSIRSVAASLRCPDGRAVTVPMLLDHGHFLGSLQVGGRPGVLHVELLVDRGLGPEVAAAFPIEVEGQGPQGAPQADGAGAPAPSAAFRAPQAADLLALVWGSRTSHQLPLPKVSPKLMAVAQEHAQDMVDHHFFAHVSPTTGNVVKRLRKWREPYLHVVENIAQDSTLEDAFGQWLKSPGHWANLMDARVNHVGVGLVHRPAQGAHPPAVTIVLVMTCRPQAGP
jgi:uncharacterized protein YkwD